MKELFLLRGLPGSGKSTVAKQLASGSGSLHLEADQYFMDGEGNYKFDASKLKDAHEWCRNEVEYAMQFGYRGNPIDSPLGRIVVSNTFTQEWEMQPYFEMAEKYGYRVHSLIVENRHGGVNEHGVPEEKIQQMKDRFKISL